MHSLLLRLLLGACPVVIADLAIGTSGLLDGLEALRGRGSSAGGAALPVPEFRILITVEETQK